MADIGFDQIREGQTVHLHHSAGFEIITTATEGAYTEGGADWRLKVGPLIVCGFGVERVELLSEPAPKWEVGQLAEVDWTGPDGDKRSNTASWNDGERDDDEPGWELLVGGFILPSDVTGEPRLLKAVPADAVVLPPTNEAEATTWRATHFRAYAEVADGVGRKHMAGSLRIVADAIEEAQR